MYRTILVPLDGSDFAEQALPLAKAVARGLSAELHLVHVIIPAPDTDFKTPQEDLTWKEAVRAGAERYLQSHAEAVEQEGLSALTAVLEGSVVRALETYMEDQDVDLVALTSHGAGGVERWWLGSVADRLLAAAGTDVLLVRPWDPTDELERGASPLGRILVPLDGSEWAERALGPAKELASRFDGSLILVRAVPKPLELTSIYGVRGVEVAGEGHRERVEEARRHLEEVARREGGVATETHVLESSGAAEGVVGAAQSFGATLIVLSSHGRSGVTRAVLGSVADKVVRSTTRPVLVVRPPEE